MPNVIYSIIGKDKFSAAGRRIARSIDRISKGMLNVSRRAKVAGRSMVDLSGKMRATSLAAAGGVVGSLKAFGDLEKGVANVLTLLDDDATVKKWQATIEGAAKSAILNGFAIDDSTKALFDNVSALGIGAQSIETFNVAQKLAKGGVTDLATAVDGITSIVNAYGREVTDADAVAQAFFTSQKKGKITVKEIADNIGKVAPIAKAAGVSYQELMATMAQLTLGGIPVEESTTAIKGTISALIKPGREAKQIFQALGVPFGTTALRAAGLSKTLSMLAKVSEQYPDLLAKAIPNIRAFTGVAALQEKELANIQLIMAQIASDMKTGEGLNKAAARQQGTFNDEMARTFGAIKIVAAQMGEALAPAVRLVGSLFRGLATIFDNLGPGFQKVFAFLLATVAIAAPVLFFFGKLALVMGSIAGVIGGSTAAAGAAVVAMVVGAVAGLGWLIFNFDKVKQAAVDFKDTFLKWTGLSSIFGGDVTHQLSGSAAVSQTNRTDIDLNVTTPRGAVNVIKQKTTGQANGVRVGVNMTEAPAT